MAEVINSTDDRLAAYKVTLQLSLQEENKKPISQIKREMRVKKQTNQFATKFLLKHHPQYDMTFDCHNKDK